MRKMRCRVCGHISEGFDYRDACVSHRKHFAAHREASRGRIFGYDALPERV